MHHQPLPPAIQEAVIQSNSAPQTPARPLNAEAVARLLSAPPAQAQNIATTYLQSLPQPQQTTIAQTAFSANITAQNAQNQLAQQLLQIPLPSVQTSQNTAQNIIQNTLQPVGLNNISAALAQPTATLITPALTSATTTPNLTATSLQTLQTPAQIITPAQTFPATTPANILNAATPSTPINASLTPAPVAFDPTNPAALITSRTEKIDIQIVRITAPLAQITAPVAGPSGQVSALPAATQFTPTIIYGSITWFNATTKFCTSV